MIENILKDNHVKVTKQRVKILETINELGDSSTTKNVISRCSDIDISTIYRILDFLCKNDILEKEINVDDEICYFIKEKHSHYFTCIKCHKREKIKVCPMEQVENSLKKDGYTIVNHKLDISGICKECK